MKALSDFFKMPLNYRYLIERKSENGIQYTRDVFMAESVECIHYWLNVKMEESLSFQKRSFILMRTVVVLQNAFKYRVLVY